jgi:hypothetical protein
MAGMQASRLALLAAASLMCSLGCATLTRPSRADLVLRAAPDDLQVIDQQGRALDLRKEANASDGAIYSTKVDYKTDRLTLRSQGTETVVETSTHVPLGYYVIDYLLFFVPAIIDYGTGKWRDFHDINVAKAMGPPPVAAPARVAAKAPAQAASKPASSSPPPAAAPGATVVAAKSPSGAVGRALIETGKLAVLDFRNYTQDLKPEDVRYFTDVVRGATLRAAPRLQIMTRENLLVLLQATGKDAASCEGECEVDTGRRIGADAVVSGELLKVGSRFKMSLRLHDTHEGRLLSTAVASGKTIDELDESAQQAAQDLLLPKQ